MKHLWQSIIVVSLVFLMLQPVVARAGEVSLAEYQDYLVRYTILLGAEDVTAKLEKLTYEEWQQLYEATPSKEKYAKVITELEKLTLDAANEAGISSGLLMPQAIDLDVTVTGEFEPHYPPWDGVYAAFAFPSVYMFLPDGDEHGFQDDRCNEDIEAGLRMGHTVTWGLAIAAQATCDVVGVVGGVGGSNPLACIAAGVFWGVLAAEEEVLKVCEVQTGNVDGAEIEAAYENTRTLLDKANKMTTNLNNETNFTDDGELAEHEKAIKDTISSQHRALNQQLTLIKNQLTQQQGQLDEIIMLLNTPQGTRPKWNQ
jgi:hypothetical protein